MKIVHCIYAFNIGGAEAMLSDIIRIQSRHNDVSLVIVNDEYDETLLKLIPERVKLYRLNRNPGSRWPLFIFRLNILLRKLKADIINIHSFWLPPIIFGLKEKLWYTVHDVKIPMTYSSRLHGVIAISESVKKSIQATCKCQIKVIPNGINVDSVQKKSEYKLKNGLKIVQVARLDHEKKGQDLLIKAVAQLKKRGVDNICVDFIGEGSSKLLLLQLASNLGIADRIRFLGLKDREYVYTHLKDYDLMCHPSRYEGFGLVVAEGMAAGLPVLVSDADGPMEIIGAGKYGRYFQTGNESELVSRLYEIWGHYDECVNVTSEAFNHIKVNYSVERMVKEYLSAYEQ